MAQNERKKATEKNLAQKNKSRNIVGNQLLPLEIPQHKCRL